jgi:hypothetical protein
MAMAGILSVVIPCNFILLGLFVACSQQHSSPGNFARHSTSKGGRDGKVLIFGAQLEPSSVIQMNCREKIAEHTSQLVVQKRPALADGQFQAMAASHKENRRVHFLSLIHLKYSLQMCQKLFCGTLGSKKTLQGSPLPSNLYAPPSERVKWWKGSAKKTLVIFTKLLVIFTHFSQNCLRKLPSEGS